MELDKKDFERLQLKLAKLKGINKTILASEIGKGALDISRDMKKVAPYETGNLRKNIKAVVNDKVAEIRSDAPYSGHVEFGKGNPKKQGTIIPYFYPTVNKGIAKMIISIEARIKKLLK